MSTRRKNHARPFRMAGLPFSPARTRLFAHHKRPGITIRRRS